MAKNKTASSVRPAGLDGSPALALKNCFFFTALLFRYPDENVYSVIRQNMTAFHEFFETYGGRQPQLPSISELQAEYISLFVNNKGFVPAVPYASFHVDGGRLMGDSLFKLRQKMFDTGFQLDASVPELEDHLAILLEYASDLVGSIIGEVEHDSEFHTRRDTLLEITTNYIQPVINTVSENIDEYGALDFYRTVVHALKEFLENAPALYEAVFNLNKNHSR